MIWFDSVLFRAEYVQIETCILVLWETCSNPTFQLKVAPNQT
jgi:hypothetical protein